MIFVNLYLGPNHIKQWENPARLWMSLFCRVQETEGQKNRFQSLFVSKNQDSCDCLTFFADKKNGEEMYDKKLIPNR